MTENGNSVWLIFNFDRMRHQFPAEFLSHVREQKNYLCNKITYIYIPRSKLTHLKAFGSITFRGLSDNILERYK